MSKLIETSYKGHIDVIKHLVESGADIHANTDKALRVASMYGHLNIVEYLVENGADVHAKDDDALRWASHYNHLDVVHYLKSIYIERYKEKFLCYDCLVLPCCNKLCSEILIKSED